MFQLVTKIQSLSSLILYKGVLSIIIFHNHFLFFEVHFSKTSHSPFLTSILWCWYYWICFLYDIPSYLLPSDACLAFVNSSFGAFIILSPPLLFFHLRFRVTRYRQYDGNSNLRK